MRNRSGKKFFDGYAVSGEQIKVMCQRRCIACVLQLPQHFGIRKYLSRITASELKQSSQQGRLVHTRKQEHVARDRGLDQRIQDIPGPAFLVTHERSGPGIAPEENILIEREAERQPHLRERPVWEL